MNRNRTKIILLRIVLLDHLNMNTKINAFSKKLHNFFRDYGDFWNLKVDNTDEHKSKQNYITEGRVTIHNLDRNLSDTYMQYISSSDYINHSILKSRNWQFKTKIFKLPKRLINISLKYYLFSNYCNFIQKVYISCI